MESVVSRITRVFFNQLDQGVIDRIKAVQSAVSVASSETDEATKDVADFVADGTDDQVTINEAINSLPNGGRILLTEGNFFITGTINVTDNMIIEGQGTSTILFIPDNTDSTFNMMENDDQINGNVSIRISNLVIDGNRLNNTGSQNGVFFDQVSDSSLNNVILQNTNSEAIRFSASTNNQMTFCKVDNSSGISVLLENSSNNNTFAFNVLTNGLNDGFEVSGQNCLFFMNKIINHSVHGIQVSDSNNIMISNFADGNGGNGFLIFTGTNSLIVGNYSINNDVRGYSVSQSSRSVISNNVGTNNTRWGLTLFDSNDVMISDNFFENNGDDGINLTSDSNSNFITNNKVLNNGINGILIDSSTEDDNVVVHNMLRNAEGTGSALQDNGTNTTTILSGNILT